MTHEFEPTQLTHQKFVVVRHGDYNNGHLTDSGRIQGEILSTKIRSFLGEPLLKPGMTVVLTSESIRAREYAEIIGKNLGRTPYVKPILGDLDGKAYMSESITKDIKSFIDPIGGFKGVILVTHVDQTASLPSALIGKEYLDRELSGLLRGYAYGIDLDQYRRAVLENRIPLPGKIGLEQWHTIRRERELAISRAIRTLVPRSTPDHDYNI